VQPEAAVMVYLPDFLSEECLVIHEGMVQSRGGTSNTFLVGRTFLSA
jgi:hypothetical protein